MSALGNEWGSTRNQSSEMYPGFVAIVDGIPIYP